jgi:class 3 adenylate cyclase
MSPADAPQSPQDVSDAPERPFPLARRYRRRVLPIMALFVVSLVLLTALSVRQAVREIHLEFAARRVAEIAAEIETKAPGAWRQLLAGAADAGERTTLVPLFTEAAVERGLPQLKLYLPTGEAVFSTDPADVGQVEDNPALAAAIRDEKRTLLPHEESDGTRYNEFYVPILRPDGAVGLVMELYWLAGDLRAILARSLVLPVLVPGLLLLGLLVALGFLIRRAQAGIDLRAARVRELSARLESFMSSSAVGALRAAPHGEVPLRRIEVSLLYSDVRRFTEFSETESPEDVVAFLNRLMTLQIECVTRHGGDVDKLIGDALLARFEGAAKERRAVAAACDIQKAVEAAGLPRGVGIGVYTGPAISGPIGPEARRDYTVIGDSVNIAARLCDAAQRGEIVANTGTLARSGAAEGFGPAEAIKVKGREQGVEVRRWACGRRAGAIAPPPDGAG